MKKNRPLVTLGITSLFLIFAVLCMVILSLLTLGSARSDLRMSKRSMKQTEAYYAACSKAAQLCLDAEDFLKASYLDTRGEKDYMDKVSELCSLGFLWKEDTHTLSVQIPFSDTQFLHTEASVCYPDSPKGPFLRLNTWQTYSDGAWTPDTKQPVFIKEITQ